MTFRRSFLVIALAMLAWPAHAADINKEGAARVKTLVESFIAEQKKLTEIDGVTKIEYQGEVLVEEAGEFYAVTLPYTKLINASSEQVDIGMVSINVSPADEPGQWKMRVAVPTPIVITDKTGAEIMRVTVGGQRAAGIWDEKLQSFVKLDALYKDVAFTGPDGSVKIPETKIVYDFVKEAAGKWSGPGSLTLKNIDATGVKDSSAFKAAAVNIDFAIDQYDSAAIKTYREKLAGLAETLARDATQNGKVSTAHTTAIANMMMDFFSGAGNGVKIRYDVTDLKISKLDPATNTPRSLTLPKAFAGLDLNGFTTGKVRLALQAGHDGLIVTPEPAQKGLTPTESNIDILIENIPVKEIVGLGKNTMDATLQQPEMQKLAGISFLFKLPALLSQAGTHMAVTKTHIGNADIDMKLEGRARADISAVNSATVDAKATIRGLDLLIARLKEQQKAGTAVDQQKLGMTITQLEQIKQKAKVQKTADGQELHVIEFTMNPQGQILLNGNDVRGGTPTGIEKPAPVPTP